MLILKGSAHNLSAEGDEITIIMININSIIEVLPQLFSIWAMFNFEAFARELSSMLRYKHPQKRAIIN